MNPVSSLPAPSGKSDDRIELVCPNGHRTAHSLARILRLDDGWCGRCGADISYRPLAEAGGTAEGHPMDGAIDLPEGAKRRPKAPQHQAAVLDTERDRAGLLESPQEESRS